MYFECGQLFQYGCFQVVIDESGYGLVVVGQLCGGDIELILQEYQFMGSIGGGIGMCEQGLVVVVGVEDGGFYMNFLWMSSVV